MLIALAPSRAGFLTEVVRGTTGRPPEPVARGAHGGAEQVRATARSALGPGSVNDVASSHRANPGRSCSPWAGSEELVAPAAWACCQPAAYRGFHGVLLLGALLSCGPSATPAADAVIMNDARGSGVVRWRLSEQPTLAIGHEGDTLYEFNRISRVATLSDGRIVVANDYRELRFFSRGGQFLWTSGRRGPGPEEFRWVNGLAVLPDDSVAALDFYNTVRRALIFDSRGRFVRAFNLELSGRVLRSREGEWIGLEKQGHSSTPACVKEPTVIRSTFTVIRVSESGRVRAKLAQVLGGYSFKVGCSSLPIPFTPFGSYVVAGDRLVVSGDSGIVMHSYSIARGELLTTIRTRGSSRPLTKEVAETAGGDNGSTNAVGEATGRAQLLRMMPPPPKELPAVDALLADASENIWARQFVVASDTTQEWLVYSSAGHLIARLTTSSNLRLHEIGDDYVLGLFVDEDGVQQVHRYTLIKG